MSEAMNNSEYMDETLTIIEGAAGLIPNSAVIPVRLRFEKRGRLRFISHLDLQRTMQTAFVRSKIPLWYTEGFNPHQKMVFALPLSIGTESVCELLDIKLTEPMKRGDLISALDAAFSDELNILDAYVPTEKFTGIGWAEYTVESAELEGIDCTERLRAPINVLKRTKSGEKQTDVSPLLRSFTQSGGSLTLILSADSENYLNPDYISKYLGLEDYTSMRRRLLCRDGVTEFR